MDVHEPGFEPNGAGFAIPPEYARPFRFRGIFFFNITQWPIAKTVVVLVFWFLSMSFGFDLTTREVLITTQPKRDSALQNDILVHESQHGASSRMTGGGTAACFQTVQAQGVDEGYADAMAE